MNMWGITKRKEKYDCHYGIYHIGRRMGLQKFKEYLEKINYAILIKSLAGNDFYIKPWKVIATTRFNKLSPEKQELIKLFYCGKSIENIQEVIQDNNLIDMLFSEKLLIKENERYILNCRRIIPYMGLFIIIDAREDSISHDHVWLGEDSIFLSNILPYHSKEKHLICVREVAFML